MMLFHLSKANVTILSLLSLGLKGLTLNVNSNLRHVAWQVWKKKALQMTAQEI